MTNNIKSQFQDLIENYAADVEHNCKKHLQKDRVLIPLIASTVQGVTTVIPDQVTKILDAKIKPEVLLEMLFQLAPVIGTLKIEQALEQVQTVFDQRKIVLSSPQIESDLNYGAKVQENLYGSEIKSLLQDLPDDAGIFIPQALTEHFFNDFYKRQELDIRDRERYELLALITMNVDFQIKAHAHGSLKAGNSESELIWSTIQLLPYIGFPFVINSVQVIHQAAEQIKAKE